MEGLSHKHSQIMKDAWLRGCYSNRDFKAENNPNFQNKLKEMVCDCCGEEFLDYPSQHRGKLIVLWESDFKRDDSESFVLNLFKTEGIL